MAKPNKQVIVEAIIAELKKATPTATILSVVCSKFQLQERTFYNYLKKAQEQHAKAKEATDKALSKVEVELAIEARKREIMDKFERQEVLTKIANGQLQLKKAMVVDKQVEFIDCVPDYADRKNAIAELNKMDGDYAPAKSDITTNGESLNNKAIIKLTDGTEIEI